MDLIYGRRLVLQAAFFLCIGGFNCLAQTDLAAESHRAKELMADQRFAEAIPIYEKLVKSLPGNTGLVLNLALAEEMGGRPERAIPNFEIVLKATPDNVPALISLGMAHLQLRQPRQALMPLRRAISLDPGNRNVTGMLADAEMSLNLFDQASEHFSELTVQDASDARAWDGLGKAYESLAARTFDRLNKSAPESSFVAVLLADTRVQRHQYRSAFFFYHEAQRQSPNLPGIHAGLARVYQNTNHADWAELEQRREASLPVPDCKINAAECAYLAAHYLDSAKAANSPNASSATLFWATKAYNELAGRAFDHLSQLPESIQIHELKARVLTAHKQYLEAADEWRAAFRLAPNDNEVKRGLASALFEAKDYRSAMPLLAEQLEQDPNASDLNYLMGASLFRTEQPDKALPYLELSLKGPTEILAADAALGLALVALNKNEEAIPHLKKALPLDDDGSLHYSLARACRAAGESVLAAEAMQQYQKIQKQNQEVDDQLAKEAEIMPPSN